MPDKRLDYIQSRKKIYVPDYIAKISGNEVLAKLGLDKKTTQTMSQSCGKTYNKKIAHGSYSLGSTIEPVDIDEEDEDEIARNLRGKCLGEVLTEKHVNLITVLMILMDRRDLSIMVQQPLLQPEDTYWNTGKYQYSELNLVEINKMLLVAAGRIQQVVVAALQILYDVGAKSKEGDDYSVLFYMNKKQQQTNIKISFKFNGQDINLSVIESRDDCYLSLYIED